mgnify:CR=1 FL=1
MKNKDFKLLVEGFNRFLIKEHSGHSADDDKLFSAIPQEFSDYINDQMMWFNGESWIAETDNGGDPDAEDDQRYLFEEVARACGCQVKDLLVNFDDSYRDDLDYSGGPVKADDFLNSYVDGGLCGSFNMNGAILKGFYFRLGTDESTYGLKQFKSPMSIRQFPGLIFVAPNCSNTSEPAKTFKSILGSAWD